MCLVQHELEPFGATICALVRIFAFHRASVSWSFRRGTGCNYSKTQFKSSISSSSLPKPNLELESTFKGGCTHSSLRCATTTAISFASTAATANAHCCDFLTQKSCDSCDAILVANRTGYDRSECGHRK